jgi:hypothetical protein
MAPLPPDAGRGPNVPLTPGPPAGIDTPLLPPDLGGRGTETPLDDMSKPLLPCGVLGRAVVAPPCFGTGGRLPSGILKPGPVEADGSMQSPVRRPMAELQLTPEPLLDMDEPLLPPGAVAARPPGTTFLTLTLPLLPGLVDPS